MAASINLSPEQRSERARAAALASHKPETWARNLVRNWPNLDDNRRRTIIEELAPLTRGAGATP